MTNAIIMSQTKNKTINNNNNPSPCSPKRRSVKFGELLYSSSEPNFYSPLLNDPNEDIINNSSNTSSSRNSNASEFTTTSTSNDMMSSNEALSLSPYNNYAMSPWSQTTSSPYVNSPWIKLSPLPYPTPNNTSLYFARGRNCLIGSLVREEGHVYSLAIRCGVLYTGSESKNIRVWKDFHDAGGFKCGSGLVKAIVVSRKHGRVFTGHQDGKIRVWNVKGNKRIGTLPKLSDYLKSSINPKSYVEVRRHHKVPKVKHYDAVSCLSLNETTSSGLMYSGSWDKTIKVWRVSDGKCLESIDDAHDDAINSIAVGFGGLVFSGSADGSVKVWRKELQRRETKHFCVKTLLRQENAVTSLAVGGDVNNGVLYAGSSDGLVNFWEREKEGGELLYGGVLRGHKLAVLCLATAGCLVFSGSADKTICVWRREMGSGVHSCLAVLSGHSGPVKCLAVEEDRENKNDDDYEDDDVREDEDQGKEWIVYSGSLDKSVRIWRVSEYTFDDST